MWAKVSSATKIHTVLKMATAQSLGFIIKQLTIINVDPIMFII